MKIDRCIRSKNVAISPKTSMERGDYFKDYKLSLAVRIMRSQKASMEASFGKVIKVSRLQSTCDTIKTSMEDSFKKVI